MDTSLSCALLTALSAFCCAFVVLAPRRSTRHRPDVLAQALEAIPAVRAVRKAREREAVAEACTREMPAFLDVMTLALSAGLSFDVALELYCARDSGPLATALAEAMLSWRMGLDSRAQALEGLAESLGVEALGRFASAVVEAIAFGSPLATVLERQAATMREERRSKTEEQIEKAPVKMLIPLGTLIVPAMMLAILGPIMASTTGLV